MAYRDRRLTRSTPSHCTTDTGALWQWNTVRVKGALRRISMGPVGLHGRFLGGRVLVTGARQFKELGHFGIVAIAQSGERLHTRQIKPPVCDAILLDVDAGHLTQHHKI